MTFDQTQTLFQKIQQGERFGTVFRPFKSIRQSFSNILLAYYLFCVAVALYKPRLTITFKNRYFDKNQKALRMSRRKLPSKRWSFSH